MNSGEFFKNHAPDVTPERVEAMHGLMFGAESKYIDALDRHRRYGGDVVWVASERMGEDDTERVMWFRLAAIKDPFPAPHQGRERALNRARGSSR